MSCFNSRSSGLFEKSAFSLPQLTVRLISMRITFDIVICSHVQDQGQVLKLAARTEHHVASDYLHGFGLWMPTNSVSEIKKLTDVNNGLLLKTHLTMMMFHNPRQVLQELPPKNAQDNTEQTDSNLCTRQRSTCTNTISSPCQLQQKKTK